MMRKPSQHQKQQGQQHGKRQPRWRSRAGRKKGHRGPPTTWQNEAKAWKEPHITKHQLHRDLVCATTRPHKHHWQAMIKTLVWSVPHRQPTPCQAARHVRCAAWGGTHRTAAQEHSPPQFGIQSITRKQEQDASHTPPERGRVALTTGCQRLKPDGTLPLLTVCLAWLRLHPSSAGMQAEALPHPAAGRPPVSR